MAREYVVPEYNEAIMCPECGEKSDVLTGLHGLIGGGDGPYTVCGTCGMVVTKSFDEPCDSHEIEGEASDAQRPAIDKS